MTEQDKWYANMKEVHERMLETERRMDKKIYLMVGVAGLQFVFLAIQIALIIKK